MKSVSVNKKEVKSLAAYIMLIILFKLLWIINGAPASCLLDLQQQIITYYTSFMKKKRKDRI